MEAPWPELQRVRRAILVVDVVESVRLMQEHEDEVIDRWRRFVNQVRTEVLPATGGRLVKSLGDGMHLEFERSRNALAAAFELRRRIDAQEHAIPLEARLRLRQGLHVSDVVVDATDLFGAGVNLAARLAGAAEPCSIVVSAALRDEMTDGLDGQFEDLGEIYLKHLPQPVRAFAANPAEATGAWVRPAAATGDDIRPVIAIVPFQCRDGGDPGHTLGDLVVDELTTILSKSPEWRVIAKLSSAAFSDRRTELVSMSRALRNDFVVTGAYSVAEGRARLHVQLLDVGSGEVLWAERADGRIGAMLAGHDEVYERLCSGLTQAIFGHSLRVVAALPMPQLASHAMLLGAVALMHRAIRQEFARARELIEALQERHPRAAQPHAWRAKWHVLRVVQGWSDDPQRDGAEALQAGRRAADSDHSSSLALTMQGLVHAYLRHDFASAGRIYDQALALNPNESLALLLKGTMHAFVDEGAPAHALTQQALALSPLDPLRYFYLSLAASAAIAARRFDEAITLAERSLRANRTHLSTYRVLAIAQSLAGHTDAARRTIDQLLSYEPGFTVQRFLERYPGRDHVPEYTRYLGDALERARLPQH
jgi:class 3 adenylate cyclase/tetratricopeptide (TPR) repeat protein